MAGCLYHAAASRLHTYSSLTKSLHVVPTFGIIFDVYGILTYWIILPPSLLGFYIYTGLFMP